MPCGIFKCAKPGNCFIRSHSSAGQSVRQITAAWEDLRVLPAPRSQQGREVEKERGKGKEGRGRGKGKGKGKRKRQRQRQRPAGLCLFASASTLYGVSRGTYVFLHIHCLSALVAVCAVFHLVSSCMPMFVCLGSVFLAGSSTIAGGHTMSNAPDLF